MKQTKANSINHKKSRRKGRGLKVLLAVVSLIMVAACVAMLGASGVLDALRPASLPVQAGITPAPAPLPSAEKTYEPVVEAAAVIDTIVEEDFGYSFILSDGTTLSAADYESEYVQFGLGAAVELPVGIIDESGEDVANLIGAPEYEPLPTPVPTPTPAPTPELPEEYTPEATPAPDPETIGEGQYVEISVDGEYLLSVSSVEEYKTLRHMLEEDCRSGKKADVVERCIKEEVTAACTWEEPQSMLSLEDAYELLRDEVTLQWTERVVEQETIKPSTLYIDDDTLEKGKTKVSVKGTEGKLENTYLVTYVNGKRKDKEQVARKVLEEATAQIVLRGTKQVKSSSTGSSSSSSSSSSVPASGTGGYWPGTTIGKGVDYPNINTSLRRPDHGNYGIMGPSVGSLNFAWPADRHHVSSYFGWRYGRMHYGVDIFDDRGSAIYASESGTVTSYTGVHSGYGNIIELKHTNGYTSRYAHLETILVKKGDYVVKGQLIGYMGDSGTTESEPHLHFEIRCNDVPYNPMFYIR